jgi:hypothetical protein
VSFLKIIKKHKLLLSIIKHVVNPYASLPQFNCFFLMPMIDKFPGLLREHLEVAYEEDLDNVFDVGAVRRALEQQKDELDNELRRVRRI